MEHNYQYSSPIRGRGVGETQSNVWPSSTAEELQGIGSPSSSSMQASSIPRTFPNQASFLSPNSQSHFQADILQEFHSPNGSSPYEFPSSINPSQQRLNQEPPWNPLQASPSRPQSELLGLGNPPFPKKRRLNYPDPGASQYPRGPMSDSGYQTVSDYSPSGYHASDPGTKQPDLSLQTYTQPLGTYPEDKYCCSSNGELQEVIGKDYTQSLPPRTCCSSVDNESHSQVCDWEDCKWTGKCESEYKKHIKQHTRPYKCNIDECENQKGFPTLNDLERHKHSRHGIQTEGNRPKHKDCRCFVPGCPKAEHVFKRADNFKAHIKRMHSNDDVEKVMKLSEDFYNQQQQIAKNRKEAVSRNNASQPQEPLRNAVEPNMLITSEWGATSATNGPQQTSHQGFHSLRAEHSSRQHPQATNSSASSIRLAVPNKTVSTTQFPRTKSPSSRDGLQGAYNFSKESSTRFMDRLQLSASVPQISAKKTDVQPYNEVDPLDPSFHRDDDVENSFDILQHMQLDQNIPKHDIAPQPPFPAAQSEDNPAVLLKLIQKTLGLNPSEAAKTAASQLMRLMRNGSESLSTSNSPRTSEFFLDDEGATNNIKPKVDCDRCKQTFTRKCDLKKHLKRHNKPYSCTYQKCRKRFGSKADWKRHENTQHFQLECWQCPNYEKPKGARNGHCDKLFYRRETFLAHLKNIHHITDETTLKNLAKDKKIGRDGHRSFWCGFCGKIQRLQEKGLRGVEERFDHLERHFLSPGEKGLEGWKNQPDGSGGKDEDEVLLDESESETGSGSGSSEEDDGDAVEETQRDSLSTQRWVSTSTSAADTRPRPTSRTAIKKTHMVEKCCHCNDGQYLLEITKICPLCGHKCCGSCQFSTVPFEAQKNDKMTGFQTD